MRASLNSFQVSRLWTSSLRPLLRIVLAIYVFGIIGLEALLACGSPHSGLFTPCFAIGLGGGGSGLPFSTVFE
jgi:hypothetical protein